jgi:hypothetical protein
MGGSTNGGGGGGKKGVRAQQQRQQVRDTVMLLRELGILGMGNKPWRAREMGPMDKRGPGRNGNVVGGEKEVALRAAAADRPTGSAGVARAGQAGGAGVQRVVQVMEKGEEIVGGLKVGKLVDV